jgi:hypothetical protein
LFASFIVIVRRETSPGLQNGNSEDTGRYRQASARDGQRPALIAESRNFWREINRKCHLGQTPHTGSEDKAHPDVVRKNFEEDDGEERIRSLIEANRKAVRRLETEIERLTMLLELQALKARPSRDEKKAADPPAGEKPPESG